MKIFYAIQATGNGHISRAMELLPHLQNYGTIDLFLSGSNSSLSLDTDVKFRSKGLSLKYTCDGNLHYGKTFSAFSWKRLQREARDLPLEEYDLILNDFEAITSHACKTRKIPSIHFGHQASFASANTPRPQKRSVVGEWILQNYAKGTTNFGLHFEKYDDFINPPVIKNEIWNALATDKDYITVYLPSYCDPELAEIFHKIKDVRFEIFSRQSNIIRQDGNITFIPVDKQLFNESLISCSGIISGAGFETPAEAIYLNKKILAIPIGGQYEQICNAAALQKLGVKTLPKLSDNFHEEVKEWLNKPQPSYQIDFRPTEEIIQNLMKIAAETTLEEISERA